jgi:hypothetical protein
MTTTAQERFERDVPEDQREDVLMMLAEATGQWGKHDCIMILEHDRIDAINARAHGIITLGDKEFTFSFRDGNHDGSVLEDWEGDDVWEATPRTEWTLQPLPHLVSKAITAGRGPFLIKKWDIIVAREEVREIVRNYAYDRMMQPGGKIENHYKQKAAKHYFEIVSKEEADATRARLMQATTAFDNSTFNLNWE